MDTNRYERAQRAEKINSKK